MLQKLREKTTGWIAFTILGLIIIPFAFFGVNNFFTAPQTSYVAKVNDAEISPDLFRARFEQYRQQMRQVMGERFDARQFESAESKREVLDRLVDEELLRQSSERLGVIVPPAQMRKEIATIPAFQTDGQFDPDLYVRILAAQGKSARGFEQDVRDELLKQALPSQLADSGFATEDYVARYLALRDQTRSFDYVVLPKPATEAAGEISDEQLQAWFEQHGDRYVSEERVALEYLEIDASKLEVPVAADESTLRDRYEEQKTRFVEPEQRLASHILIKVPDNADADAQKAAQARAQALAEQSRAEGADFAALAKAESEDPGSKNTGGDLGWIERGITNPTFEDALYAMQAGTVSDPVKSSDGWHVIQLREIKAETGKPFEEVRGELEREYLEVERERLLSDLSGRLVDVIYRDPTTLGTASEELELPIQRTASFTRAGGEGIAAHPDVLRAAFSEEQLVEGTVSNPIDLGGGRSVVIRAVDHVPAQPQKLDDVRDQARAAMLDERLGELAAKEAEAALEQVRGGATLSSIAEARKLEPQHADKVGRVGATVDPALSQHVFAMPHPVEGKPSLDQVALPDGRHALVALSEVIDGDPSKVDAAARTALAEQLSQAIGVVEATAYVQALRKAATIEVVEDRL